MPRHGLLSAFLPESLTLPKGFKRGGLGVALSVIEGPKLTSLRAAIDPLLPAEAEAARRLYRGRYHFAHVEVEAVPDTIFSQPSPDAAWARALHGFEFLPAFAEAGGQLYRAHARALLQQWTAEARKHPPESREDAVAARRAIHLSRHAGFLLGHLRTLKGDPALKLASALLRDLLRRRSLDAAIGAAHLVSAFSGADAQEAQVFRRLGHHLDLEILADGGHVSRNPGRLCALLCDLVPLRDGLARARLTVPSSLQAAIDRALPMLKFFLHGDGGLAQFHRAGGAMKPQAKAILESAGGPQRCMVNAPHMGFLRLAQGHSLAIMDGGEGGACDAPLAFEFSDGPHRLVVNCGHSPSFGEAWALSADGAAAHSTADLREAGLVQPVRWFTRHRQAKPSGGAKSGTSPQGAYASAWKSHTSGLVHERSLYLAASGKDLRGEDGFAWAQGAGGEFRLRFHLHPSVRATLSQDGSCIMLLLPNRQGWRFTARGGEMSLDESVYLAGQNEPRQCRQIVVSGVAGATQKLQWAFKRIEKRAAASGESHPELPF